MNMFFPNKWIMFLMFNLLLIIMFFIKIYFFIHININMKLIKINFKW